MEFDGNMSREEAEKLAIEEECRDCSMAEMDKWHGSGRFQCAGCCARLVISARPDRRRQEAMLETIRRFKGSPSRQEVISEIAKRAEID